MAENIYWWCSAILVAAALCWKAYKVYAVKSATKKDDAIVDKFDGAMR